ncbi:hypothetical protein MKW98_013545, partial [Papaver atlanticum]
MIDQYFSTDLQLTIDNFLILNFFIVFQSPFSLSRFVHDLMKRERIEIKELIKMGSAILLHPFF